MANDIREHPNPFGWIRLIAEPKEKAFQSLGDRSEYFRLMRKETDRGCAMIVAAHLDDKLGGLLKSCIIQAKKRQRGLRSFSGDRSAALPIVSGWHVRRPEKYGPQKSRETSGPSSIKTRG